jgi:hypothetical protein
MDVRFAILALSLIVLIYVFALYIYFFPTSVDFFANPNGRDSRLRSEPSTIFILP